MNKLTLFLAAVIGAATLTPVAAEARDRHYDRRVAYHCRACGDSIYQQRYYSGRDRYGRPIYNWRNVSHRCHPRFRGRGHHHHHHGSHYRHSSRVSLPGIHIRW